MTQILFYIAIGITIIHGLIHLMGLASYWKLAEIEALPYKTTVLAGRCDLGDAGIRVFGLLWAVGAIGFIAGGIGLWSGQVWWQPMLIAAAILSLILTALDWNVARLGVIVNIAILTLVLLVMNRTITLPAA